MSAKYNFPTHTPPIPADNTGLFPGRGCLPVLGWCRSPGGDHYHYFYVPTVCQALGKILHILLASQVSWREELFFFFFAVRKQEVFFVGGNGEKWTSVKK